MAGYTLIDHTADIGFRVRAPGLASLFVRAAQALFDLTCDLTTVEKRESIVIRLQEPEPATLMVRWLNELIFVYECRGLLLCQSCVEITDPMGISAVVWGEKVDLDRHRILRDFKAATYHGLYVRPSGRTWTAQIILDV